MFVSCPSPWATRPNKSRVGPPPVTGPLLDERQRKAGLFYLALAAMFVSLSVAAVIADYNLNGYEATKVALTPMPVFAVGLVLILGPRPWRRKAGKPGQPPTRRAINLKVPRPPATYAE